MDDYNDYNNDYSAEEIRDIKNQIKMDTGDSNELLLFESGYLNGLLYGFRRYLDVSPSYVNKSDILNILYGGETP